MTIEVTILISIISVSFAIFAGMKNLKKADTDSIEERARKNAEINLKLDNLLSIVSQMNEDMKELTNRLTKDEKETELLTLRYAELEKRVEKLEGAR